MNLDNLLIELTKHGLSIHINPSEYAGFDLQINTDDGIVYHDPNCDNIEAALVELSTQVQLGQRLIAMAGAKVRDNDPRCDRRSDLRQ